MGKVIQLCQWHQLWACTFIINVASIVALVGGNPDYMQTVGYNSSKGAVISMTRDLATSWAKHDITVNAIAPGWFPTRMSGALIERFEERMLDDMPLGRLGTPEDLKGSSSSSPRRSPPTSQARR